jgi:hypothetical protein
MRLAWQFAQLIASTAPTRVLCCTTKTLASVAHTAPMLAHLARHSSQVLVPLVCAAKWTNAHSVLVAQKPMVALLNLKNMDVTA